MGEDLFSLSMFYKVCLSIHLLAAFNPPKAILKRTEALFAILSGEKGRKGRKGLSIIG